MGVPQVVTTARELQTQIAAQRSDGKSIGFVPTMGALHEGHLSLVDASIARCGLTVVSIFVNPTQFAPHEDFNRYPRDLAADLASLGSREVNLVFAPSVEEMFPADFQTYVEVERATQPWEGAHRPNHFRGVTTVVAKLFNQVQPNVAFFGHKDYQQSVVIRQMVKDLAWPIEIEVCPTVREPDGLALSSRNAYLSDDQRRQSLAISAGLRAAAERASAGEQNVASLSEIVLQRLQQEPDLQPQYVAIVDPETLEPISHLSRPAVALVAAFIGNTRLIDNWRLEPPSVPTF